MSDIKLALTYLRTRMVITTLTVLSVALGLGLAVIVLGFSQQTKNMLRNETKYWDIVVGAKGSPLQLIMNSLYYIDAPTGNITRHVWEHLEDEHNAMSIVPVNMGDNYYGTPIIGTTPEFFAGRTDSESGLFRLGAMFSKPYEAVVGAEIAANRRLAIGSKIIGSHGWGAKSEGEAHADSPYTVVGILRPTGTSIDRGIFSDYHSVWEIHAHHDHDKEEEHHAASDPHHEAHEGEASHHEDEIAHHDEHAEENHDHEHHESEVTSLLIKLEQPGRRFQLVDAINAKMPAMAVVPVDEVSKLEKTFLSPLQNVLLLVAYLVVVVAALSVLISLYLTIHQRRRDIAVIRSLGATRSDVLRLITLEGALISGLGVIFGWLAGHGLLALIAPVITQRFGIPITPWQFQPIEGIIVCSVWVLGVIAALLPAIVAYRLPVAESWVQE